MSKVIGYGTAYESPLDGWQGAEAIGVDREDTLGAIAESIREMGLTEADFNSLDPLYLTEVRTLHQITWEDVNFDGE